MSVAMVLVCLTHCQLLCPLADDLSALQEIEIGAIKRCIDRSSVINQIRKDKYCPLCISASGESDRDTVISTTPPTPTYFTNISSVICKSECGNN